MLKCTERWAGRPWLPWVVWGLSSLFIAYQYAFQTSSAIMVPEQMRDFHLDAAGIGFLSSTFFYTYLLLQVPAGFLIDRYGVRTLLVWSMCLCLAGIFWFASATHLMSAVCARMLVGMAAAPAVAAAFCLGANWFPPARFALIVGLSETVGALGGVFCDSVMSDWVQVLGWRHSLWVMGSVGVAMVVAMFFWVEDYPATASSRTKQPSLPNALILMHLKTALTNGQVWLNAVFCGLTFAVNSAFAGLWSVPYLQRVHGLSYDLSTELLVCFFLGVMLGSPLLGWLCDRYGRHQIWMRWGAFAGVLVTWVFLSMSTDDPWCIGMMLFLIGVASAVYVIPFANVKAIVSLEARGAAMAFTNTACIAIGAPVLQPFMGWVLHHGGVHGQAHGAPIYTVHAFHLAAGALVVCSLLAWLLTFGLKPRLNRYDPVEPEALDDLAT